MEKLSKKQIALRVNISEIANRNIDIVRATLLLAGTKLTKEQAVDHIISSYKEGK